MASQKRRGGKRLTIVLVLTGCGGPTTSAEAERPPRASQHPVAEGDGEDAGVDDFDASTPPDEVRIVLSIPQEMGEVTVHSLTQNREIECAQHGCDVSFSVPRGADVELALRPQGGEECRLRLTAARDLNQPFEVACNGILEVVTVY